MILKDISNLSEQKDFDKSERSVKYPSKIKILALLVVIG